MIDLKNKFKIEYIAIIIAMISLIISGITIYKSQMKPFSLEVYLQPMISIQYKSNFGIYVMSSFFNNSPNYGSVTDLAFIISKTTNIEDKYLLTFSSFRVITDDGLVYKTSDEKFPIYFKPWERQDKISNFLFDKIDFPISSGTYECEFLVYQKNEDKPYVISKFKFDISASKLKEFENNKIRQYSNLIDINISGYRELTSRKLTIKEYNEFIK